MGVYECDDGNLVSGDGCNSECQVEHGFSCEGGSDKTPDVCIENFEPAADISTANSKSIYVSFDEKIIFNRKLN